MYFLQKLVFKFPKGVIAVAGAAAMMVSIGFVSSEANEAIVEEVTTLEEEEEEFFDPSLRIFTGSECRGSGGNCLPTVEVTATAIQ